MKCRQCNEEAVDKFYPSRPNWCKACTAARSAPRNPEKDRRYRLVNKGYYAAKQAEYAAAKKNQTPTWSETKQIEGLYKFAAWLSGEHGTPIEVDHIVPLQGKNARGLHCMDNLQLLHRKDNRAKGNTLCV